MICFFIELFLKDKVAYTCNALMFGARNNSCFLIAELCVRDALRIVIGVNQSGIAAKLPFLSTLRLDLILHNFFYDSCTTLFDFQQI